ncbi:MAG: Sec-independent protein translocase protein TatB [Gammaproteobacteria bacterium]
MFEIGFQELMLVALVALLVLGPERLPGALRTMGLMLGRLRRSFDSVKVEIEREIGMEDIRRQLHNEAVMDELKRIERDLHAPAATPMASGAHTEAGPASADATIGSAPTAPRAASDRQTVSDPRTP